MKIFRTVNPWPSSFEPRTVPFVVDDQTAIGFIVKSVCANAEDDERINSAADDRQDERGQMAPRISEKNSFIVRRAAGQ